jgi:PKHD-type hydroxylase
MHVQENPYLTAVGQFPRVFPADDCRRIIELPLPTMQAEVYDGQAHGARVDYRHRRTNEKPIPPMAEYQWIYQRLGRIARESNASAYHFQLSDVTTAHVLEYTPDGFFDWHLDLGSGLASSRKLTMVTFLTPPEEYEGGDLCFMDSGDPLRLPQGTTVIFPSYLLHKVEPVTKGSRFTLVSWVHGPCFS